MRRIELFVSSLLLFSSFLLSIKMADGLGSNSVKESDSSLASKPGVHIVYTEPAQNEDAEAYHIRTLTAVLGSEEAAKDALLYSYKTAANGFSAKLTPQQVEEISRQPGVLQVVESKTLQLHSGPGKLH